MRALCDKKALYLRNVPEEVSELAAASRRVDNAELLAGLPDLGVPPDEVIAGLDEDRGGR